MRNKTYIRRGDIFMVELGEGCGTEQSGTRPGLVLQNNTGNKHSPSLVIAALTCKMKKNKLPTHVFLPEVDGQISGSTVLLEQIRTIDKERLIRYMGHIESESYMQQINKALCISIGLTYDNVKEFIYDLV
ncbi:type II toxin-antitoxin system PemK/MazF family toxin [Lachnospiraceae bacterium OttesenSCG-928-D06]|nr:type II toxin-antitoxin system PemK/MazF family toxin [Lachnospiraceae bacterium OttesenSCG-928-D06]